MKKLAITIAAVFATLNIFAQTGGTVNLSNIGLNAPVTMGVPYILNTPTGAVVFAVGAKAPGGLYGGVPANAFSVALYYAPYDAANPVPPDFATLTQVGASAYLAAAGTYNGGTRNVQTLVPPGYFGWFQVRAWAAAFGSTYEQAAAATLLTGLSSIVRVDTGDPNTVPPGTPGQLTGISGIVVGIPEPSMIGLGLLGGVALLLLRRRK